MKKKINLQKLISLKFELYWEFYWWLDSMNNKLYRKLIKKEKDRPKFL